MLWMAQKQLLSESLKAKHPPHAAIFWLTFCVFEALNEYCEYPSQAFFWLTKYKLYDALLSLCVVLFFRQGFCLIEIFSWWKEKNTHQTFPSFSVKRPRGMVLTQFYLPENDMRSNCTFSWYRLTCLSPYHCTFRWSSLTLVWWLRTPKNMLFLYWYFMVKYVSYQGMASTIGLLPKKHFLCSLCEHIFTNPVTTPCGHSFCKVCLRKYWTQAGAERCPSCKKDFGSRPHLSVNRILADVTENYRMTRQAAKRESHRSEEKTDKVRSFKVIYSLKTRHTYRH